MTNVKHIELAGGHVAIIDAADFDLVSRYKWSCQVIRGRYKYVVKRVTKENRHRYLHRLLTNAPKGADVDHKNGDTLDNRKSNLRVCTRTQNQQNRMSFKGKSKFKGVHKNSAGHWRATIVVDGNPIYLGTFKTEAAAAVAYNEAAVKYFSSFARLNSVGKESA